MPKGQFTRTDEHRKHISEALKGRPHDLEWVEKIANGKRGKKFTPQQRRNVSEGLKRRAANGGYQPWTDEQRAALSEQRKGWSPRLLGLYGVSEEEQKTQSAAGNKWCCVHKAFVPVSEFSGTHGYCKVCAPIYGRTVLMRKFGVTAEWYDAKLAEQGGGCAICGNSKPRSDHKFLPIDHNHKSGKVRGILCNRCNHFVGEIECGLLAKALAYLFQYS